MVFCNTAFANDLDGLYDVTILILIDGFLQYRHTTDLEKENIVTILILIDGFLQYEMSITFTGYCFRSQSLF